jgi:GT2 family glycosyltransferase
MNPILTPGRTGCRGFTGRDTGDSSVMGDVTIVVATRDRAATLMRTLDRLRRLPDRIDLLVVDNASTDGTPERVALRFPGVRVLPLPDNRGAVARNLGVAAAATSYVAFADDDSWWEPGALTTAARLLDRYPRLALIAARTLVGPDDRLDPMSAFMAGAPLGRADDLPGPSVLGFLACAAVVRREAFLRCGGFDPVVFFMGEEGRLAYDLAAAGWGLAYCAEVTAHHDPPPPADAAARRRLAARNAALTAWMRRPVRVATAQTRALLHARPDPATLAQFAVRLPRALARRRAPDPAVEAGHALLARAGGRRGAASGGWSR